MSLSTFCSEVAGASGVWMLCELRAAACMQEVQDINVSDGMLSVTVVEAKHIPKGDFFTESNPYVA